MIEIDREPDPRAPRRDRGVHRALARGRARRDRRLAPDARQGAGTRPPHSAGARSRGHRQRDARGEGAARVDGGQPLHVPRLPRIPAAARIAPGPAGAGAALGPRHHAPARRPQAEDDRAVRRSARIRALRRSRSSSPRRIRSRRCTARPTSTTSASRPSTRRATSTGERRFLGLWTSSAYSKSPGRDSGAAPQGAARHRPLRAESLEPRPQGARARAGDVPARRAVPGDRARPRPHRARHRQPLRARAGAAVRAPRPVPPLLFLPRVRAARPLQHAGARAHREARARGLRRRRDRVAGDAVRVRARAAAHAGAHAARRRAGRRRGRARAPHHGRRCAPGRTSSRTRCSTPTARPRRCGSTASGATPSRPPTRRTCRSTSRSATSALLERAGRAARASCTWRCTAAPDQPPHKVQFKLLRKDRPDPDLRRPADDREPRPEADQRAPLRDRQRAGRRTGSRISSSSIRAACASTSSPTDRAS